MDKKNTIIGIFCLLAAFTIMFKSANENAKWQRQEQERQRLEAEQLAESEAENPTSVIGTSSVTQNSLSNTESATDPGNLVTTVESPEISAEKKSPAERPPEQTAVLRNDYIAVEFTSYGGAIKQVSLLEYPAKKGFADPYIFNAHGLMPALGISLAGADDVVNEWSSAFELVSNNGKEIVFKREEEGVDLIRKYSISSGSEGAEPYLISHTTQFVNRSNENKSVGKGGRIYLNVGTASPSKADPHGYYLNFGYYDGLEEEFITQTEFNASSGFLGIGRRNAVKYKQDDTIKTVWASVKNQFFASVLTVADPKNNPGSGYIARSVDLPPSAGEDEWQKGITGSMIIDLGKIGPESTKQLDASYYVGPKEYHRLDQLDQRQDLIMQFGWFSLFSQWLLIVLIKIEALTGNYGVAIILMTIIIRTLLWPLTAKAAKSSKKMAKIQEPLKELREKYKDKPEKLNKATMALFKEHQVNPAAGCLPVLVQIPIFISFFYMLKTASELRFAEFLWVRDLSQPENIVSWGINIPVIGEYLNILPLLMGATMYYQMRMTPTTLDSTQAKVFKMLPFIFTFICYTFASGLVLYWTISNCLSILQQFLTNRSNTDEIPAAEEPTKDTQKVAPKRGKKRYRKPVNS